MTKNSIDPVPSPGVGPARKGWPRVPVGLAAAAVVLGAAVAGAQVAGGSASAPGAGAASGAVPAVDVAYQGVVEHDERRLAFELAGKVESVAVARGERVAPGAALLALDPSLARTTLTAREAELAAAEAQVRLLEAGSRTEDRRAASARARALRATEQHLGRLLARERQLVERGVSVSARVDELEAQLARARGEREASDQAVAALRHGARPEELDAARARARAAGAGVTLVKEQLGRHALASPVAGTVTDLHVEVGEVVGAGAPVVTVADLAHPYVEVFVPQAALGGIRVGTPARVTTDAAPLPLAGRVEHVAPRTEFTPRYLFSERERHNLVVRVRVRVEDPEQRLHAGVPAVVVLERGR